MTTIRAWVARAWLWTPLGIMLLAYGLRVFGLSQLHSFGDQNYSVWAAHRSLADIATDRLQDGHPPLYYYLLHFWIALIGDGELPIRYLSLLPGVLTVAMVYKLGDRVAGRPVGTAAALLAAISPFLVYYSRIPRMYSLVTFLLTLALFLAYRWLEKPRWWLGVGYGVAAILALYTHYYAAVA
ncbi:MAG: glycosyltransferase family 39 protein, partial [Chloroflexi bacterium]|nr:glycosyltransferase family 39 protein [Chloroflexota bacterium]